MNSIREAISNIETMIQYVNDESLPMLRDVTMPRLIDTLRLVIDDYFELVNILEQYETIIRNYQKTVGKINEQLEVYNDDNEEEE